MPAAIAATADTIAAAPAGPAVWSRQFVETDVDAMAKAQEGFALHYEQLTPGRFQGRMQMVQLPGMRLVMEHSSRGLRQRGAIGEDCYGFALPLDLDGEIFFAGQRAQRDSIMMGRGDDIDLCTPVDCSHVGVVIDGALLRPLWEHMYGKPLVAWLERQLAMRCDPAPAAALRELHLTALERVSAQPRLLADATAVLQLRDALLMEWIEAVPPLVDASGLEPLDARRRLVERARELMLSRPDEPMSVLELCQQVGASRRKLSYCFQDVLGISPAKYLRALRLNAARRALRNNQDPRAGVQDIAARLGFWHFGQFALDYKRQFGELPSETLKRGR